MSFRIAVVLGLALAGLGTRSTAASGDAGDVLAFERQMEAAVVRGDVKFLDRICTSDFSFTHGDAWTTGGQPLRVENRANGWPRSRSAPTSRAISIESKWSCTAISRSPTECTARDIAHRRIPSAPTSRCGSSGFTRDAMASGSTCRVVPSTGRLTK
jgi:hypothetical protein